KQRATQYAIQAFWDKLTFQIASNFCENDSLRQIPATAPSTGTIIAHYLGAAKRLSKEATTDRGPGHRKGTVMKSNAGTIVRVLKRLKAAVGYQELGMTKHALRCLDSLES